MRWILLSLMLVPLVPIHAANRVLVSDIGGVKLLDPESGELLGFFGETEGKFVGGLAVHPTTGNLFTTIVRPDGGIGEYARDGGAFLGTFGETAANLTGASKAVFHPTTHHLFVLDDAVKQFDGTTGAFLGSFSETAKLRGVIDLDFNPSSGNLFLATREILEFDGTTGALVGNFGETAANLSSPFALAFHPTDGNLWVADFSRNDLREFDGTTGAFLGSIDGGGTLTRPRAIFFSSVGTISQVDGGKEETATSFDCKTGETKWSTGLGEGSSAFDVTSADIGDTPIPSALPEEQCDLGGVCSGQETLWRDSLSAATCSYGRKVYLHSGEEHFERTDLAIPGRGDVHFVLRRSYRSKLDYDGPLGFGWDFSYNEALFPQENGDVVRVNGRGHLDTWVRNPDGTFTTPAGFFRTLLAREDGTYVTRSPEGFKRFYRADGKLERYEDRYGNTMHFQYDDAGNIDRVIDPYSRAIDFTFESFPDGVDRLVGITDFSGREVVYSYDENGDLVSVRTPVVAGTSTGNDFPAGRVEEYTYSSGHEESQLNHNLLSVTYPEEVAVDGPAAITWTYGEDPSDPLKFDRVLEESVGGGRVNASNVPAGGTTRFQYELLNQEAPARDLDLPRGKATVTERNGNVLEFFVNERNHHIITRRLTRGLRDDEPAHYETRSFFDADGQLTRRIFPAGNEIQHVYGGGVRAAQHQIVETRRVADESRGGGEDLVTTRTYEPLFSQLASITDPRGNAAGFEPPLGEASPERYTTRFTFDWQEGTRAIAEALEFEIDLVGFERGLGDLNGDGRTDQTTGNTVRVERPTVQLLADSKEAARLGSTSQEIVTLSAWNDHGQLLRRVDPEGDVVALEYFSADDPDGDGTPVAEPIGTDPSGYLRSRTVDAPNGVPGAGEIPPVALETVYGYDPVGNVTSVRNPRGVLTTIEVNALNEPVLVTRGADIDEAVARGELITGENAFRYLRRMFYDHNGRVVKTETENRADVSTTDGVGEFVERTVTYDILNHWVERTVEVDSKTTLTWLGRYDENELPTLVKEPEGNEHRTEYDERNLPWRVTRGLGSAEESTAQIDYDLNANRARLTDAEDNDSDGVPETTVITYDGFDRPTKTTDALGNQARVDYDVASNAVRQRFLGHPAGVPEAANVLLSDVHRLHDELHRVYQINHGLFLSEGFTPVRAVDLRDEDSDDLVTERFEYDRDSRMTCTLEDDLQQQRTVYDGADRPVERIDHLGNRRLTSYDQNSNAIETTSVERSPEENVPEERFTTLYVYDQLDRVVRATDNLGQTTRFSYDSRDNLTARADPEGDLTADPLGLFGGEINEAGNTKAWFYDGLDRRVRQISDLRTGGRGGAPLDLTNPENPDGQVAMSYRFDGNSRLVARIDDNGNETVFGYDALNRRTLKRNADLEEWLYTYDRDDNPTAIVDPNGSMVTSTFDALHRLVRRDVERAPGIVGTTEETYAYDGLSRWTLASDNNGAPDTVHSVERVYDSLSRILEERQRAPRSAPGSFRRGDSNADGDFDISDASFTLSWLFLGGKVPSCLDTANSNGDASVDISDASHSLRFLFLGGPLPLPPFPGCGTADESLGCASYPPCEGGQAAGIEDGVAVVSSVWSGDGKRLSFTYPGGRTLTSTFDAIDRVKTTSDAGGSIAECSWIGPGYRELRRVCGNGTTLSYLNDAGTADVGYDGVKRAIRQRCFLPDGVTAFLDREYTYNRADVRQSEKRNDDQAQTDLYSYDSLYRLKSASFDQNGAAGASPRDTQEVRYVLDGVGNRRQVETDSVSFGTLQTVHTVNEMNEYAQVGDAARLHDANGNLTEDATRTFAYDYRNRLVNVLRKDDGTPVAHYFYDALNRRARKTMSEPAAPAAAAGTTLYLYDGWRVCEEQSATGTTETTYVWSPTDIDGLVEFQRTGAHSLGAGTFYAHQNTRADVVALTDGDGNLAETFLYDDFGNPSAASAVGNPYLFQGRRLDEETGLYYFRNRYFDPDAGRFLQRDPLWDAGNSGNQYSFAGNGPVAGRDALGLRHAPGSKPYDVVPPASWGLCTEGPGFGLFDMDLSADDMICSEELDITNDIFFFNYLPSCDLVLGPDEPPVVRPEQRSPPVVEPEQQSPPLRPSYEWEGTTHHRLTDEEKRRGRFLKQQRRAQADRQQSILRAKRKIAEHRAEIGALKLPPTETDADPALSAWMASVQNESNEVQALENAITELEAEIESLENSVIPDLYGIVVLN